MTKPPGGDRIANQRAHRPAERTAKLEWALAGLVIWLISLDICLGCPSVPEPIFESARGTTERPGTASVMVDNGVASLPGVSDLCLDDSADPNGPKGEGTV